MRIHLFFILICFIKVNADSQYISAAPLTIRDVNFEVGFVSVSSTDFTKVTTQSTLFTKVHIFMSVPTAGTRFINGGYQSCTRIKDVNKNTLNQVTFNVRITQPNDTWCNYTWWTPVTEPNQLLSWMAIKEGHYFIFGAEFDVSSRNINGHCTYLFTRHAWYRQFFNLAIRPASIAQAQTYNDYRFVSYREVDSNNNANGVTMYVQLHNYNRKFHPRVGNCIPGHYGDVYDNNRFRQAYTVTYEMISILGFNSNYAANCMEGMAFESHQIDGITSDTRYIPFYWVYTQPPGVFGMVNSFKGGDSITLRSFNHSIFGFGVMAQEDQCDKQTTYHFQSEKMAFIVIGPNNLKVNTNNFWTTISVPQSKTPNCCNISYTNVFQPINIENTCRPLSIWTSIIGQERNDANVEYSITTGKLLAECQYDCLNLNIVTNNVKACISIGWAWDGVKRIDPLSLNELDSGTCIIKTAQSGVFVRNFLSRNATTYDYVSIVPTLSPTRVPTRVPTTLPSKAPSIVPTIIPTVTPSTAPTVIPTTVPNVTPTQSPIQELTTEPTTEPTIVPTTVPNVTPTNSPITAPSDRPHITHRISRSPNSPPHRKTRAIRYISQSRAMCDIRAALNVQYTAENSNNGNWQCINAGMVPRTNICNWHGVGCNEAGTVTTLHMNSDTVVLPGTIPTTIGALSHLSVLELNHHNITGSIPSTLSLLTSLTRIDLHRNSLIGSFPTFLYSMVSLGHLILYHNFLTGSIASTVGLLTNLESLSVSSNYLNGIVPSSIGQLSQLTSLYLGVNSLTGSLPSSLTLLTNLRTLSMYSNALTGVIPSDLDSLVHLASLSLSYNQFHGVIPSSLGLLSTLTALYLRGNSLTGTIPDLSNNINLEIILLNNNHLTGSIPTIIGSLVHLSYLSLSLNSLIGTIPIAVGLLANVEYIALNNNLLTGLIPSVFGELSHLNTLYLDHNNLGGQGISGSIPQELCNNPSLTALSVNDNTQLICYPGCLSTVTSLYVGSSISQC